jgi:DNA gyrase/topoisomerase IV subunit A
MFLKRLRTRRANKTVNAQKETEKIISSKGRDNEEALDIELALTMSLSHDEGEEEKQSVGCILSTQNEVPNPEVVTFTQQQVMQNSLFHLRQLNAKQEEITKLKVVTDELKATYAKRITEKEEELAQTRADFEDVLQKKQNELTDVKEELVETKQELSNVCSVLIQTQHALHVVKASRMPVWSW